MVGQQHKSPPPQLQKPNENHAPWLFRRIWDRINTNNEHFMGVIIGREGSGKSYTSIKISNAIDPSFSADRIIFDVIDLLEILDDGSHEPGNFYVLDEAGVQMGRRTWQDRAQVLANQALQLIRSHNLGLLFTLPRLAELDSQTMGRLQAWYNIQRKVHDEYVVGNWKFLDPDRTDRNGQIYEKYPRRRKDGEKKRITSFRLKPPTCDELIANYEERKETFQKNTYQETIQEAREETADDDADEMGVGEIAQQIIDNEGVEKYVMDNNGQKYIDRDFIEMEYDIGSSRSKKVKKLLQQHDGVDAM